MITSPLPVAPGAAPSAAPAPPASALSPDQSAKGPALNSDFQTFLQMLTVQMQNQDPLNPIDSTDYAVQLATFSSVEQQVVTNDLLTALGNQFGVMQISQLGGWVGMEVRSTAPAHFDGAPVHLSAIRDPLADSEVLVVKTLDGAIVHTRALAAEETDFSWDGTDADGNTVPDGLYQFELESYGNGNLLGTYAVESYSRVMEVRKTGGAPVVVIGGGWQIPTDAVTALRTPG